MKQRLSLLVIVFFFPVMMNAQDSTGTRYSLKEAVDYALNNQASVKNALIEEKIAKQKVNEIIGLGTPQITGSAELNDFIEIPTSFIPGEFFGGEPGSFIGVKFGQKYTASAGVSVSQLIFDGSYLVGLQATRTYQDLSRKQTHQTRIETGVSVSKAYYGALVIDQRMAIVEANLTRVNKVMSDTKALYQNGFAEKIDADRIELTYNNLLVEQDNVRRMKVIAYALLKFQMGLPANTPVTLTDHLEDLQLQQDQLPDSADFNKRPEYNLVQVQRQLQSLDLKRYKSAYYPSLIGFGSVSANASRNDFTIFDGGYRWYPTAIIGLKLSVPIWDGFQRNSQVQQSKLKLLQVDNSIENLKNSIQLDYRNALSNYQNNIASLETTKRNRDLATEISRVAKVKYDNGVGSSLELIDAESSRRESDANYFNTLYNTIVSRIDLDKASGNLNY